MYCSKCGTHLEDETTVCSNCDTRIGNGNRLVFDYKTVDIKQKKCIEAIDCYESLGWTLVNKSESSFSGNVTLSFKRDKKIKNKSQLCRLEAKLDDSFNSLTVLEKEKTRKAKLLSVLLGILGTLILGGGMSICLLLPFSSNIASYIVGSALVAIGAVPCSLSYLTYTKVRLKATAAVNILIDKKRDEISIICEDAQKLFA